MTHPHLKNRHYICMARCSTTEQADTSIPDQLKLLHAFASENGMIHAGDDVILEVTGSIPGARSDIDKIMQRKRDRDDFDVVLVQDMSRFTRGGAEHGMKLEYDLRAAGIEVIFVADNLPEGDHAGIIKSVGFYAAQQHAKSISFNAARGQMSALARGRIAHCSNPPYGVDRLIVDSSGVQRWILHNLPDGRQLQLYPASRKVLNIFPPNPKRGPSNHYRLQGHERIVLIPGADEQVQTVRDIFRWKLLEGWGRWRIAKALNDRGIPAAKGGCWSITSVANILQNPIYTGLGLANRYSLAVYNMRSPNSPTPAKVDPQVLATRKRPQQRIRPRSDWFEQEHPLLRDYLQPELRELAVAKQAQWLQAKGAGRTPKFSRDRHINSPYLLKKILRCSEGGHVMSGRTVGPRGRRVRYYAVSHAYRSPTDARFRRMIPAEAIEQAVLKAVREALLATPDLKTLLHQQIVKQMSVGAEAASDLTKLKQEREELRLQVEFIIDSLGTLGRKLAEQKIQQLENRLADLEQRIRRSSQQRPGDGVDIDEQVELAVRQLVSLGESLEQAPAATLRNLLPTLIASLEVDLQTRALHLELRAPQASMLCVDGSSPWLSTNDAQHEISLILAVFDCNWAEQDRCFDCRRRRAA